MKATLTAAAFLMGIASAHASTPAAWDRMNVRAARACLAMSGLARPELLAQKISFSDTIGVEIRMIRGIDKGGRTHRLLCAFERKSGRTEIQEAATWNGPTVRP